MNNLHVIIVVIGVVVKCVNAEAGILIVWH